MSVEVGFILVYGVLFIALALTVVFTSGDDE